jgi:hypothetical protein
VDPIRNPYSPNAGAPPPALVGRDGLVPLFDGFMRRVEPAFSGES